MTNASRLSSAVSLNYTDDSCAHSLRGNDFLITKHYDRSTMEFRFTDALQSWNKALVSYAEAKEFIEKYQLLASIDFFDSSVIAAAKSIAASKWRLSISCGERGIFEYTGRPQFDDKKASFTVTGVMRVPVGAAIPA